MKTKCAALLAAFLLLGALSFAQTAVTGSDPNLRAISISFGADNATSALADADIAPQIKQYQMPSNATIREISVSADTGTPTVLLQRRRGASTVADLQSATLVTGAAGALACAMSAISQTCLDGTTSSGTVTLSNATLLKGDWIEPKTATAGGVAKHFIITVVFSVNN